MLKKLGKKPVRYGACAGFRAGRLVDSMAAGNAIWPCTLPPLNRIAALPGGHSLINASVRSAHLTKPIYPESARIKTVSSGVLNNRDDAGSFKSIGEIGAAIIKRLGKRLGK